MIPSVLRPPEDELPEWVLQQARASGLDLVAQHHAKELIEATRITRAHLAELGAELQAADDAQKPGWPLS